MQKPSVFIGSSTESLEITYSIQELLNNDAEITPWTQLFKPSSTALDDLITRLDDFDFGIFVFSADDLAQIRGNDYNTARDNVVFELGLFIGNIGKTRNFVVMPVDPQDFRLPSDLLGLNRVTFDPNRTDKNLQAALGSACNKIRTAIKEQGIKDQKKRIKMGKKIDGDQVDVEETSKDSRHKNKVETLGSFFSNKIDLLGKEEEQLLKVFLDHGKVDDFALTYSDIVKHIKSKKNMEDDNIEIAITKLQIRGFLLKEPGRIKAYSITELGWKWLSHFWDSAKT